MRSASRITAIRLVLTWFFGTILDVVADVLRRFGFNQCGRCLMIWIEFDESVDDSFKFVAAAILVLADHGIQVAETFRW